jgi:superfamily I DNA/RNA helicase
MNPFESARSEAGKLRADLVAAGLDIDKSGYATVKAACGHLDIRLKEVRADFPLLKGADATVNVARGWLYIRDDFADEVKAFLAAHEIGHVRLHPSRLETVEVNQDALSIDASSTGAKEIEGYGARERRELQANVFSREFLLPRSIARSLFVEEAKSASRVARDLEIPLELVRLQLYDGLLLPNVLHDAKTYALPAEATEAQRPAVESMAQASLVEAGPGTGKTTALLLRLRRLIREGVSPENVVVLTFSNKAARELVERARAGKIPGADRVWIGTFHAFGLEFLRKYGHLKGLNPRFPVLDKLAVLAMLESDLPNLNLAAFDTLGNPSPWLENAVDAIRRAKDEVLSAKEFEVAVRSSSCADPELKAKQLDVATLFRRYEFLMERNGAVDFADLLCQAIRILQSGDKGVSEFKSGIQHVLVDEYQDVNRASALLVKEISEKAKSLWVVGDSNQAIYAFMGASSLNLDNFQIDFPGATRVPLVRNHRSSQEIVDAFGQVATRNPANRSTIKLGAEKGAVGYGPKLISTPEGQRSLDALSWRIRQLETQGVPLAEQVVIVYRNATAAEVAARLEAVGVPVLFLGNIFERAEIKDLLCLMQLATDRIGVNLVRQWNSSILGLSRDAADQIFARCKPNGLHWMDVDSSGLSSVDTEALTSLIRICRLVLANDSPWDAIAKILLEDGQWLRELIQRDGQAAENSRMAVWQFVHFCRAPDGTGRWATVRNLPQRIRERVRLNEDRSTRVVPPEAERLDAVRILTAHGSKGLEFDAVHLLEVTKKVFEPDKSKTNKLIPQNLLSDVEALESLRNERHNLLYVAMSRPRFHLTLYLDQQDELPSAVDGLLAPIAGWSANAAAPTIAPSVLTTAEVSLSEYLDFVRCPRRHEFRARSGSANYDDPQLFRAIGLAADRAIRKMKADPALLIDPNWRAVASECVQALRVAEFAESEKVQQRVLEWVSRGRDLLLQGGALGMEVPMQLGPLRVLLNPDQVFNEAGSRKLRFIRTSSVESMKQPLAALLDANRQTASQKTMIEIVTLSDGERIPIGSIQTKTRIRYQGIATDLCSRSFPPEPNEERVCHFCPYLFPCDRRVSD